MPTVEQLSKLFKALARGDLVCAEREASAIAAEEQRKGHTTAAQLLKGALASNGTHGVAERASLNPADGGAALLAGVLQERVSVVRVADVALSAANRKILDELAREFKSEAMLHSRGIRRRSKLIFHGPPGCGKTLTAQALANALGLPIYVVRFDAVVGSYLGQTAMHLRKLFQFAETTRCVLLFDEIDALGKRRGSPSDVGELDRIVVALMQELELSQISGFVVATSNLAGSLDDALWRRFDLSLRFATPTKAQVRRFVSRKARQLGLPLTRKLLAQSLAVRSYADAERVVEDCARQAFLKPV